MSHSERHQARRRKRVKLMRKEMNQHSDGRMAAVAGAEGYRVKAQPAFKKSHIEKHEKKAKEGKDK